MKIYTHWTKNDLTAWAPIKLGGPNKIWGAGIDLRTPWKIFFLKPWLGVCAKDKEKTKTLFHQIPALYNFHFRDVYFKVRDISLHCCQLTSKLYLRRIYAVQSCKRAN